MAAADRNERSLAFTQLLLGVDGDSLGPPTGPYVERDVGFDFVPFGA